MPLFSIQDDDGNEVQVDTDDLPGAVPDGYSLNTPSGAAEGHVTREHFDAQVERARQEAGEGLISRENAAEDQQVVQAVLAAQDGDGDVDIERYQEEWERENVAPLREQLEATQGQVTTQALLEAGREAGVREEYLKGGADSFLAHRLGGRLEFDSDLGPVATDGDGNRLPGGEGRAYANARDLLSRAREDEGMQGLFGESTPQGGGGSIESGAAGSKPTPKRSDMSRKEKREYVSEHGSEEYFDLPE